MQLSGHEQQRPGVRWQLHICALSPVDRSAMEGVPRVHPGRGAARCIATWGPVVSLCRLHRPRAALPPMHQPRAAAPPWAQQNQPSVLQCN